MLEFEEPTIEKVDFDEETNYAKFECQPLERGYGMTIGNSLRRVLLSSLPGAAITGVKIEGIQHEFMTIPNVVENVMEVLLNLKSVRFAMHTDEPKVLKLNFKGKGEVLATDIKTDADIEVLNKNLHIATTSKAANLNIELIVEKGRGYNSIEQNKKADADVNLLAIDSIFTPVKKVNYSVEATRVGKRIDFDKLTIEIWTDGSITPEAALSLAARITNDHLALFINLSEEGKSTQVMLDKEEPEEEDEKHNIRIEELGLTNRSTNSLRLQKIETLSDLLKYTEDEVSKFRNLGEKSLTEIKEKITEFGVTFRTIKK